MPADDTAASFDIADSSDEDVVRQVLAGQTAMYELLMRRHNERLYRAARAITRNDGESEEVMQQTYVSAFANLHQFNGHARFATWLTRIAINESLATVRRRVKYEPIDDDSIASTGTSMPSMPPDPERQAFTGELRDLLEWAIDGLADGTREVFVLREVEGLSTAETAECLCRPASRISGPPLAGSPPPQPPAPRRETAQSGAFKPALRPVLAGETRVLSAFSSVECAQGAIVLQIDTETAAVRIAAARFEEIEFLTYRQDTPGSVACGPQRPAFRVLATFRTGGVSIAGVNTPNRAVAIELLPDGYVPQ